MSNIDLERLKERIIIFDQQLVTVHDFEASGYILDIGGGGEGIIGILKGEHVISIDSSRREIEEGQIFSYC